MKSAGQSPVAALEEKLVHVPSDSLLEECQMGIAGTACHVSDSELHCSADERWRLQ